VRITYNVVWQGLCQSDFCPEKTVKKCTSNFLQLRIRLYLRKIFHCHCPGAAAASAPGVNDSTVPKQNSHSILEQSKCLKMGQTYNAVLQQPQHSETAEMFQNGTNAQRSAAAPQPVSGKERLQSPL
jgi:hypothetical protein